ncbi:nitrogenase component 1 [Treponema sp. TIM-1]|uniref:nitrogenase component 1 n=1 Tax=Treponema sp. TIM-1 TaxID=2898417 RepID=UPI00397F250F
MSLFTGRTILSREKRVSTLSAYMGTIGDFQREAASPEQRQRIRTLSQARDDDILAALELLSSISETVTVIHGAAGCSAAAPGFYRGGDAWYSTGLNEQDTILGGGEKLRAVLTRAWEEHHPRIIFILGTPVVAINNDDVNSVVLELEGELDARIIPVMTDGFKSKTAVNGIDMALQGIGRYLAAGPARKVPDPEPSGADFINLITVSENRRGVNALVRLAEAAGFVVNLIPRFGSAAGILRAGKARASIAVNDSRADVFLRGVEETSGVISLRTGTPIGADAVSEWLLALGKTGGREEEVLRVIEAEQRKLPPGGKPLEGRRIFVDLPAGEAAETALFLESLGAEITGLSLDFVDETNMESLGRLPAELLIHVGDGQVYELASLFSKTPPDFYIAQDPAWAAEFGVIPLSVRQLALYGYEGAEELAAALGRAEARTFTDYLHENLKSPYKEGWLKKNPNWHIKQEVK